MTSVHPTATVVDQRGTFGAMTIVDVGCPFGRHRHSVGLAGPTAVLWCSYTGRHYRVDLQARP